MANEKPQTQIPGEPVADSDKDETQAEETQADEQVTVSKSTLDAMQQKLDDLTARVDAGPRPAKKTSDDDLPDASTIDTALIKSPVLTKSGWMVPNQFGSASATQPK